MDVAVANKDKVLDDMCTMNLAVDFEANKNPTFFTHLSQNKEATNFIDNQGLALNDCDIALDFLDPNISLKVKERLLRTRSVLISFINTLVVKLKF